MKILEKTRAETSQLAVMLPKRLHQKRCIHDNFIYTQNVIKALHKAKRPSLFIKLDISKAFDSVCWVYLLEVLQALGFGQ
jgi:late competence protein required for DNA uptake (superfamily II DNA/RNA helicase)